ncbi:MAG: Acetate kinase [Patescibacteria group bacterium]|nr:Acetate kinase [Patescibacteria group bacterium]
MTTKSPSLILVLNSGSSSIKYALFSDLKLKTKGLEPKIGVTGGPKNHYEALNLIFQKLKKQGYLKNLNEIKAVGHRVVHGGENFKETTIIDNQVLKTIKDLSLLAPLHNPPNVLGIETCQKLLPHALNIAIFDTAFYSSLAQEAFLYALPRELYEQHQIRKYGFHGISHQYIVQKTQQILKNKADRIISCHLGAGSSLTAVKNNQPVDTTMGFTPLEGLIMTTRSGSIDPFLPIFLIENLGYSPQEVDEILNQKSGYLGICGLKDFKEILKMKTEKSFLCYQMYLRSVVKYLGSYLGLLDGAEAIVFTGGIGSGSAKFREDVISYFQFAGIKLDRQKNYHHNVIISAPSSKIKVLTLRTNEELMIAQEVLKMLKKQ